MSINQLFDQFLGSGSGSNPAQGSGQGIGGLASKIPGGLAGGAAAGGIVALLVGSKSARKVAGKAATYGGAALLGGMAYKAYQNWSQQNSNAAHSGVAQATLAPDAEHFHEAALATHQEMPFELTLIRGMIAAARSDGHIDAEEQKRIFAAVDRMDLSSEHKGFIFDCLQQDIPVQQLASAAASIEQKTELYLASSIVIDPDHPAELAHLEALAQALGLPKSLCLELDNQARQIYAEAA